MRTTCGSSNSCGNARPDDPAFPAGNVRATPLRTTLKFMTCNQKSRGTKGITVSSKIHFWKSKNQRKFDWSKSKNISGISGFTLELGPWPYLLLQIRPASAVSTCSQPATGACTHTMTCPGKFFEIFESTVGGKPLIPALHPSLPQDKFLAVQLVENK